MGKKEFDVAFDEEIMQEMDKPVAECDDLGGTSSEIGEPILTAFIQSESNHAE